MNYLQKLFINSVVDIFSDILCVDLESGDCSYVYTENKTLEEIQLPQKWDEAKHMLLESIIPEDHAAVLEKWDKDELDFEPTCPYSTYEMQINAMRDYIAVLEARAVMEKKLRRKQFM